MSPSRLGPLSLGCTRERGCRFTPRTSVVTEGHRSLRSLNHCVLGCYPARGLPESPELRPEQGSASGTLYHGRFRFSSALPPAAKCRLSGPGNKGEGVLFHRTPRDHDTALVRCARNQPLGRPFFSRARFFRKSARRLRYSRSAWAAVSAGGPGGSIWESAC